MIQDIEFVLWSPFFDYGLLAFTFCHLLEMTDVIFVQAA